MLELIAINTDKGIFISDNTANQGYWTSRLDRYLYDGQKATPSWKKDWYFLSVEPTKVERIIPEEKRLIGFTLKEEYKTLASDKVPASVAVDFFQDIDDTMQNAEIYNLYDRAYKAIPETYEETPFTLKVIAELKNFDILQPFTMKGVNQASVIDREVVINDSAFKHSIFDELVYNKALLPLRPCAISQADLYKIVRAYIIDNIDKQYAKITSNYDFCLTVTKVIEISEPEAYEIDENYRLFGKKRKPHMVTKYRTARDTEVFECAPAPYQRHTVIKPITAETHYALKEKIEAYLKELITMINEPVVDCSTCEGRGVVYKQ